MRALIKRVRAYEPLDEAWLCWRFEKSRRYRGTTFRQENDFWAFALYNILRCFSRQYSTKLHFIWWKKKRRPALFFRIDKHRLEELAHEDA